MVDRVPHDLGVIRVAPTSPIDLRVPTADEESLDSQIHFHYTMRSVLEWGWTGIPQISVTGGNRRLAISGGKAVLPVYPGELSISTIINLPGLPGGVFNREDRVYLASFAAEVGESQDPALGEYTFSGRYLNSTEIVSIAKENTRRLRAFWMLIWHSASLTSQQVLDRLPDTSDGHKTLTILDKSENGFELQGCWIYAQDPNLSQASYKVFSDTVQLLEICRVARKQNLNERGYIWGLNGEEPIAPGFHVMFNAPTIDRSAVEVRAYERLQQLIAGRPSLSSTYNLSVQNLLSVPVGNNPGFPGEAAGSPNGSSCLANNQRVSFSNQGIIDKLHCIAVPTSNDGNGSPVISLSLNSPPFGSFFSNDRLDHKVFSVDGIEQAERGTFTGLGTTGLNWVGGANSTIIPGQTAYLVPGIFYAPGSGLSIPFTAIDRAWQQANTPLSTANIRHAAADLAAYEAPTNSESFFLVYGPERAAIHYILKRVSVTTNASGVATIPTGELGCFAFIEGVAGRIDLPIVTGLLPNTAYNALVYYPPRSSEAWQVLVKHAAYQGIGKQTPDFLNGATIISRPQFICHTQGGGGSVHQSDSDIRMSPIAMHLPTVDTPPVAAYRMNGRVRLPGESKQGPITLRRDIPLLPASGLTLPAPGHLLSTSTATNPQSRSMAIKVLSNGHPMGFRLAPLAGRTPFQAVVAFAVEKAGERRLVVVTRNSLGNEDVIVDSDQQTAIDVFYLH